MFQYDLCIQTEWCICCNSLVLVVFQLCTPVRSALVLWRFTPRAWRHTLCPALISCVERVWGRNTRLILRDWRLNAPRAARLPPAETSLECITEHVHHQFICLQILCVMLINVTFEQFNASLINTHFLKIFWKVVELFSTDNNQKCLLSSKSAY